jgi:glycosyltransferase involved in cell wall biosynthesis
MGPTVSVVMPTLGRPAYVRRAINSVLDQSFADFELLVLDNSTEPEKEMIREMSAIDSRLRFVDRGDIGLTEARKLGAVLSRGKLYALLDSDDFWTSDRLQKHVDVWSHNRIGLSWDRWAEVQGSLVTTYPQPVSEGIIAPHRLATKLYKSSFIHASAGVVSTKFAKDWGFPLPDILSSDWVLFMRAAERYPAYFIGETLSFKETHAPQRVSDIENEAFLRRQNLAIRRWALLNSPGTYGLEFIKWSVNRLLRRFGHFAN